MEPLLPNEINESLKKIIPALEKHSVDFIIIGGTAVAYYGHRRISGGPVKGEVIADLDFWYKPTTQNFTNLVKALKDLNVNTEEIERIIFDPKRSFLKIPHKTFHTDFLPQMAGLDSFKESKKNTSQLSLGGSVVPVISYDDLVKNKQAVSRAIDKADLEALKKKKRSWGLGM